MLDVWLEGPEATTALERLRGVSASDIFRNPPKWLPPAQVEELRASLLRRRLSIFVEGNTRILFTAPHTLELLRDGHVNHVAEVRGFVARDRVEVYALVDRFSDVPPARDAVQSV